MRCDRVRERIGALLDGELNPQEEAALRAHLDGCPQCAALVVDGRRLSRMVAGAAAEPVPRALAPRLRAALAAAAEAMPDPAPEAPAWRRPLLARHARLAAAVLVGAVLSAAVTWWVATGVERSGRLAQDVVTAHIRSLLQDSPVQVASSESHTVKPWFAGRADFAPAVRDLSGDGFPLVGGRLDYVQDRRVGVVVYKRRLHVINLFMWPAAEAEDAAPRLVVSNGYNALGWTRNGVAYWAVSDLNAGELRQFQGLL